MVFVWIFFIWAIFAIIYFGWKWVKEKKRIKKFKTRIRNYDEGGHRRK